jgi:hypothetical protein
MSKIVLSLEEDYDFDLVGISCHSKDYRLCWELNNTLGIDLTRTEDLTITKKEVAGNYSFYEYDDEENHLSYYLMANKCSNGYLIPEKKTTDFFILIKGIFDENYILKILSKINSISLILTSFQLDPNSLKSKQNLLF